MMRRSFLSYGVAMMAGGVAAAQMKKANMEGGKAVVCEGDGSTFHCGACGHTSCQLLNATIVIGNENRSYPESSVLFDYHFVACDHCNVLSVRKS